MSISCSSSRCLLLTLLIETTISYSAIYGQQSESQFTAFDSGQLAASMIEALWLNNRSIESYDVLCTRETLSTKPGGEVSITKSRYRYCFDRQTRSRLGVVAFQGDYWEGNDSVRATKHVVSVLVTPDGEAFLRDIKGVRVIPAERTARSVGWPTFLTIGLERFPDSRTGDTLGNLFWERVILGRNGLSSSWSAEGEAIVRLEVSHSNSDDVLYRWVFDAEKMVPSVREVSVRLPDGTKILKGRERIEWKSTNGVLVPTSIHGDIVNRNQTSNGEVKFEDADDTDFVWNQVNGDFDDSFFKLDNFVRIDPAEFLVLTDIED